MNYLKVPDSDVKLTDGSIVMLHRFPGTKWVVHNGWYNYAGRRCMGWYFCSIPAQTVIPVNNQDLQLITVIAQGNVDPGVPNPPDGPGCGCPPGPPPPDVPGGTYVGPGPCGCPPGPPGPPPCPPPPDVETGKLSVYTAEKDLMLQSAFISVPTLKQRDALDTAKMPDGKIVRVNSVEGKVKYFQWSHFNDRWEEISLENKEEELLDNYYDKTEIDLMLGDLRVGMEAMQVALADLDTKIDDKDAALRADVAQSLAAHRTQIDEQITATNAELAQLKQQTKQDLDALERDVATLGDQLSVLAATQISDKAEILNMIDLMQNRLNAVEEATTNIQMVAKLTTANTVLVYDNGTVKNSGYSIGDDEIGEPAEYANSKTLATEKAVAQKVEAFVPKWQNL